MVQEYKKLSQSFEEVKAERESCATKVELVISSYMQAALSKLETENEELRSRSQEMLSENQHLSNIISSWTRSSASLDKLHGAMKPSGDRSGLGYGSNESSTAETNCLFRVLARHGAHWDGQNFFKSLEETGLKGFLEVSGSVFEGAVIEFFANANVIARTIVSFVANRKMVITKDVFAEEFGLTTEGMISFIDLPAQIVTPRHF
ncbi:hypothetical protein F511_25621 [Dorcoceras hygrometricum]|uniref:Uncharacterized protein n=1 Tax=Dorcoceras hygrometricum TaxID=472368 RepID=A0A2Z7D1J3_9LAMI|nr:hypothetical protein F511_25621 [Dorcoceras hygrometricum]